MPANRRKFVRTAALKKTVGPRNTGRPAHPHRATAEGAARAVDLGADYIICQGTAAGGASGVFIGTRFVATREAFAHAEYRAALLRAGATDAVLGVCFQDGWINAPPGAPRNQTMRRWEAEGCPPPGRRSGEGALLAVSAIGTRRIRYSTAMALQTDVRDRIGEMCMYAGRDAGDIDDIPGAGELVERLWKECLAAGKVSRP